MQEVAVDGTGEGTRLGGHSRDRKEPHAGQSGYEPRFVEAPFVGDDAPQVLARASGACIQQPLQAVEFWRQRHWY